MGIVDDNPALLAWLSSPDNPPVRYLTARDLLTPAAAPAELARLRDAVLPWPPLREVLALQQPDGSFPARQKTWTSQPTFWALCLLARCGLDVGDEPVARAVDHLRRGRPGVGALSYTSGASGVLPCYVGVVTAALIELGALHTDVVRAALAWLVDHQRFDHAPSGMRAGGEAVWPYRAPATFGCWDSVSCYHGVAGAFRALAAVPPEQRSAAVSRRLDEAIAYLRRHRLYRRSRDGRPLFQHLTRPFLVGDYRSDLLDMLQGVADADPGLVREEWVREAVADMAALAPGGRVTLARNYGRKLVDPIPFERVGEPSRFLTYQWVRVRRTLAAQ